ncbi:helix-turn-helix domain-containing protein [Micromonospora sp. RTGN7]|uniref:TetR/AcrR family transcriptional regulator n=1 Tax=Micromonospora sp. RTGN7 TaxID=3016526 RepID=UPI0029FF23C6|nr:helix-turn-helix domain-containing protein [Micromonospora sp. RTGN7]
MARAQPETPAEILAAAGRRFAVTGYKGTSLQDIAREVGVSKATVLYHFANKEALLGELMAPAIAALRELDDRFTGLRGTDAQRVAGEGFVDLSVHFRREIALLRGEFPNLLQHPAFASVHQISERLITALAGHSTRPAARVTALVVLAGIAETCGEFDDIADDELREALLGFIRRALETPQPTPPPSDSPTIEENI